MQLFCLNMKTKSFLVSILFLILTNSAWAFNGHVTRVNEKGVELTGYEVMHLKPGTTLYVLVNGKETGRLKIFESFHTKSRGKLISGTVQIGDTVTDIEPRQITVSEYERYYFSITKDNKEYIMDGEGKLFGPYKSTSCHKLESRNRELRDKVFNLSCTGFPGDDRYKSDLFIFNSGMHTDSLYGALDVNSSVSFWCYQTIPGIKCKDGSTVKLGQKGDRQQLYYSHNMLRYAAILYQYDNDGKYKGAYIQRETGEKSTTFLYIEDLHFGPDDEGILYVATNDINRKSWGIYHNNVLLKEFEDPEGGPNKNTGIGFVMMSKSFDRYFIGENYQTWVMEFNQKSSTSDKREFKYLLPNGVAGPFKQKTQSIINNNNKLYFNFGSMILDEKGEDIFKNNAYLVNQKVSFDIPTSMGMVFKNFNPYRLTDRIILNSPWISVGIENKKGKSYYLIDKNFKFYGTYISFFVLKDENNKLILGGIKQGLLAVVYDFYDTETHMPLKMPKALQKNGILDMEKFGLAIQKVYNVFEPDASLFKFTWQGKGKKNFLVRDDGKNLGPF